MKKILIASIVCFMFIGAKAQRSYDISGISVAHNFQSSTKIMKADYQVIINDSSIMFIGDGKTQTLAIVQKVDDNYFKVSDGLQSAIIKVTDQKSKKYSGFITQQMDDKQLTAVYYYK